MKKICSWLVLAAFVLSLSSAVFSGIDKPIEIKGKQHSVSFVHKRHTDAKPKGAGLKCADCHPKIVAKMKAGANKITMATCGTCHKAKGKAFDLADKNNCVKCHVKPKA